MLEITHQCIGKYALRECLGRGGISEVWKAFDPGLQRYVAVKLLQASRQSHPDFVERVQREARVVAGLDHPNIVDVYDISSFDLPDQNDVVASYMVMRYIEGGTLADYIARTSRLGKFPNPVDIVRLFASIAEALDYAHMHGVIHCDVKPANILLDKQNSLTPFGEPILTDFGLVKLQQEKTIPMANSNTVIGTPFYIAPEQAQGYTATAASDLYSLGIILYELCTGKLPFDFPNQPSGQNPISVMLQQVMFDPVPPTFANPGIPTELETVILKSIAKDPKDRFSDAKSFVRDLAKALAVELGLHAEFTQLMAAPHVNSSREIASKNTSSSYQVSALSTQENRQRGFRHWERGQLLWRVVPLAKSRLLPLWHLKVITLLSAVLLLVVISMIDAATIGIVGTHPRVQMTDVVSLGQISFLNSGQGTMGRLGINDEIHVDLSHLAAPEPGKKYYAWLLSDSNRSDSPVVFLGALKVVHGSVHLAYVDQQHSDLLALMSRVLVTEEDAEFVPTIPSPDQTSWLGIGTISQAPNKADLDHFSLLDHLRHLLVADPTLDALGLHGGLSYWLFKNEGLIQSYAQNARMSYGTKDTVHLHRELVRLLDYIDGIGDVARDLPPGMPILVDPTFAQVGLLQVRAYQSPPSYMYHIGLHLNGMVSSPGVTTTQMRIAQSVISDMNVVRQLLEQMRTIARRIVVMPSDQLFQPDGKLLLTELDHLATIAYTGQDNVLHGVTWIHEQLAALAVIPVTSVEKN